VKSKQTEIGRGLRAIAEMNRSQAAAAPDTGEHKAAAKGDRVIGWTEGDGSGRDGYSADDYFDGQRYIGPDAHGIEPIFEVGN